MIEITLRPVSVGVSFLAATIQATGDSVAFSHSEPATLLSEVLGQVGKIDGVTLKLMLLSGLWMMTGFLHNRVDVCDASGLAGSEEEVEDDDDDGAGYAKHGGTRRSSRARSRRRWEELDEQRLLANRRENKSWGWIFSRFTEAAIRVRVHLLQKAQQSRRSQTAETIEH